MTAFLAGLLSFASPCVLPLVPSYLMYITGLSLEQLNNPTERGRLRRSIAANSCLFIAGFALVFIAFGASASAVGRLLTDHQDLIRKVGAGVMILFGLHLMGIFTLSFLMAEKRVHLRTRPAGYLGSIVIGATFAAGWTPCVGPVLGTMLLYASTTDTLADGVTLLAFYSLGLGLPLFAAAMGLDRCLTYFRLAGPYLGAVSKVSGAVLIIFGLLLYDNSLAVITAFLERHDIGVYLDVERG
ncbi:MAG: cytochrome c biogenesis protein CcdA [Nitrospiraceae bacterium]